VRTPDTMAVVLSTGDEGSHYFAPSSSGLRRSHSQSQFGPAHSKYHHQSSTPASNDDDCGPYGALHKSYSHSALSSETSSPRIANTESTDHSFASTPASNFSLLSEFDDDDDEEALTFEDAPQHMFGSDSYKSNHFQLPGNPGDNLEPPPSPKNGNSYTPSPDYGSAADTPQPDTAEIPEHAEDDTAISVRPSRQVDYLSHEWRREEDIWSSWRYIVHRRGEVPNSARLENASWRTWMQSKNNLKTTSPEVLNWYKDQDVTWLYGPLQQGPNSRKSKEALSTGISKSGSLVNLNKKPILKKRSMSEVMLQRSISAASLLKQATAAVQAQESRGILRPSMGRANTDYTTYTFSSRRFSNGYTTSSVADSTTESSGVTSPGTERKHIHFNESVEQCIAVDIKGEDEDDVGAENAMDDDSDSDDGFMMMRTRSRKRSTAMMNRKRKQKPQVAQEASKTIAMLPSTTLKYRADTPEPPETAMKHSTGRRGTSMSPSSSQETLRPSTRSRFFISDDDTDEVADGFCDPNTSWRSPGELDGTDSPPGSPGRDSARMRRTASGMLMPYEEGDLATGDGLFGRVIETVNTARDIAHVIWNVGWRK